MVQFQRVTTSDLEMPLIPKSSQDESDTLWKSSSLFSQLATGAALLVGGIIVCVPYQLVGCEEVAECLSSKPSSGYHIFSVFALAPLLLSELLNLVISYNGAKEPHAATLTLMSRWQCSLPVCLVLFNLLVTDSIFFSTGLQLAHAAAPVGLREPWRPVYTVRYIEWLVNVPILLSICGHFCLGRPKSELLGPIFLTDVYIFLSWEAFVVNSAVLSWVLVIISFVLFAWASYEMLLWAITFMRKTPGNLPARGVRASMLVGIVIVFAFYGLIYLLAIFGVISASMEEACYTVGDAGVKVTFCIAVQAIRAVDSHHVLDMSMQHISNQNCTMNSLLRGSFDVVMKCTLDLNGNCWLPSSDNADLRKLEHLLNRSVAGCALNQLLDSPEQQSRFHSYVMGTLRRGGDNVVSQQGQPSGASAVAQVINCDLSSTLGHGEASRQTVVLHLSGVSAMALGDIGRTAFIAMCFPAGNEEVVPLVETQGGTEKGSHEIVNPPRMCSPSPPASLKSLTLKSLASLSVSESEESSMGKSEKSFGIRSRTSKSRRTLPKVPDSDFDAFSNKSSCLSESKERVDSSAQKVQVVIDGFEPDKSKSSLALKEYGDKFVQTDAPSCSSTSSQTDNMSRPPRPPISPPRPGETRRTRTKPQDQDTPDIAGGSPQTQELSQEDTPDVAGGSPQTQQISMEEKMRQWKERKERKKKKGEFSEKKKKGSYGSLVRREMDVQAGRISPEHFDSGRSMSSLSEAMSQASQQSSNAEVVNTEPSHVVSHRSPCSSDWDLPENDGREHHRRSWVRPAAEQGVSQ